MREKNQKQFMFETTFLLYWYKQSKNMINTSENNEYRNNIKIEIIFLEHVIENLRPKFT